MQRFNGQAADGRTLRVSIVGSANATLGGRLGLGVTNGTVDNLMEDDTGGSLVFFVYSVYQRNKYFLD